MSWGNEAMIFQVVINHEGQYSIWPDSMDVPRGWTASGKTGEKHECLAYIKEHWKDMRPSSQGEHLERARP